MANLAVMAVLSAMVKSLADRYPVGEILLFRFAFSIFAFLLLQRLDRGAGPIRTGRPLDHAIRTCCGIVALALFYYSLATIPLADATILAYSAPIFIVVFSIPILGEKVGVRRWSAVLLGFLGVVLIAQPEGARLEPGVLAGIGSAVAGALVSIWLRRLNATDSYVTIGLIYNCTGTLIFAVWVAASGWITPTGSDLALLIGFGLLAGIQQVCFTLCYRYAEASYLAPFEYTILILAAALGYLLWGEVPTASTWAGALIIALSGAFVMVRARVRARS